MTSNSRFVTSRARTALVCLALAVPLVGAESSLAHTLTSAKARAAASKQAERIKRETDARTSSVVSCNRQSTHKVMCKVRSRYSVGLPTCDTNVLIYYATHSSRTPRAKIGRSVCS